VYWQELSSTLHGGLPQHRDRIYIVGIRRDVQVQAFDWPAPFPCTMSLKHVLGGPSLDDCQSLPRVPTNIDTLSKTVRSNLQSFSDGQKGMPFADWIVNCGGSKVSFMKDTRPCLTASRCKDAHGYWSPRLQRFLDTSDMLALQGWPQAVAKVEAWRKHTPDKVLREMAGNGMCLGVLRRVLKAILVSRGILH